MRFDHKELAAVANNQSPVLSCRTFQFAHAPPLHRTLIAQTTRHPTPCPPTQHVAYLSHDGSARSHRICESVADLWHWSASKGVTRSPSQSTTERARLIQARIHHPQKNSAYLGTPTRSTRVLGDTAGRHACVAVKGEGRMWAGQCEQRGRACPSPSPSRRRRRGFGPPRLFFYQW